ncbi:hypothetical protein [Streptosporangium sp. CA-115845]|uniref:hypothetical protein n=1 Tax=Streptosporangium sp. CA-115845 TaxID=3240071 RepID=UPI003D8EFF18
MTSPEPPTESADFDEDFPGDEITDVDAEISADDVAEQVEVTINRLLSRIPDAKVRYQVARELREGGQLPRVMALSAQQLVMELGSIEAAADELGFSRQYLTRFLKNHEYPTPRQAAKTAQEESPPAHRYGELLEVLQHIAERYDEKRGGRDARNEYDKIERNAINRTTVLPALMRAAQRWLKPMHGSAKNSLQRQLDSAREAAGELPSHFNTVEQSQVILGLHSARARRRRSGNP